ncbi:AAA family ATPase [Patescibacteria group bacterium]|nr:AAA family ATPase [Patescibacteria group bacterium]MBU2259687.1 AAA family ATPase [Patescibacteria group bacterium]
MKCVIIIGPQAVGKMTVGRAIAEKTGYKLLHNHMTIDFILNFFEWGSDAFKRLDNLFRFSLMEEAANSDLPGFIFTFMFALNRPEDWEYVQRIEEVFQSKGHEVVYLELEAGLEVRKKRNTTPLRLEHKPSKRNIEESQKRFLEFGKEYRLNSKPGEFEGRKHLRINNENLSPEEVAERAIRELRL